MRRRWRATRRAGLPLALASASPFAPALHQLGYLFSGVTEGAALRVFAKL